MKWRSKRVAPSNSTVPTAPGIYAIARLRPRFSTAANQPTNHEDRT